VEEAEEGKNGRVNEVREESGDARNVSNALCIKIPLPFEALLLET